MPEDKPVILKKKVSTSPMTLLEMAVNGGADIETIERLQIMYDKWQKEQARKSFLEALSNFQSICPIIKKKSEADFKTKTGQKVNYKYANLSTVIETIKAPLKECGLSFRWKTEDKGDTIIITCIVGHTEGHEETNTMSANADVTGLKNPIQARGSTINYLERYTLVGSLGIGTADTDDDGKTTEKSIDDLKDEYLKLIDPLLKKDYDRYTPLHPDNWNMEQTIPNYLKALQHVKTIP